MTPLERYQADLIRPGFSHDAAQENSVRHLQRLYDDLIAAHDSKPGLFVNLFGTNEQTLVQGLYFWGGVGRGKPDIVDSFCDAPPFHAKCRPPSHRSVARAHHATYTL
ncbi:cell division protein ZapE, partial [Pseudomonas syringae]